jgi:hypothetical protein
METRTLSAWQRAALHPALVEYSFEKRSKQFSGIITFLVLAFLFNKVG